MVQEWQPPQLACAARLAVPGCGPLAPLYLALLVELYGGARDPPSRQCSSPNRMEPPHAPAAAEEYDFIVVGAGSAGCVVANRLTENEDWKVLLLEAGSEQPDVTLMPSLTRTILNTNIDWAYKTLPDGKSCLARPGGRCSWPRGKTMGGSSSINGMVYVRGHRLDYDAWAAAGNRGWGYEQVLKYFKKAENNLNIEGLDRTYHGVTGPQRVERFPFVDRPSVMLVEAYHEKGLPILDVNGPHQEGIVEAQSTAYNGQRYSTNNAYIQPIRYKRKNLTVKPNSEVVKILIDEHKRAYGVKYIRDGHVHTAVAKKEVIISAGSINSPKLLMLSGIGPREHLQEMNIPVVEDLHVGYNLHDHVAIDGLVVSLANETAPYATDVEILEYIEDYKAQGIAKKGPLTGNGANNAVLITRTLPHLPAPDLEIQHHGIFWKEYLKDPIAYDAVDVFPTAFYDGFFPRPVNNVPLSRGRLYLNSTDPHGKPLLFVNYFGDRRDLDLVIRGAKFALSLENTKAFKSRGARYVRTPMPACRHLHWGTDEYIECLARSYTSPTYHPVGTCKMGPKTDETAVVDPRLRVYGIKGLRVIDCSIMPAVPRGNTNAPAIMVGEKGADLIKEDWTQCPHELGDEDFLLS